MVVQDNGHDIAINMDMVPANEDEIADQDEDDESLEEADTSMCHQCHPEIKQEKKTDIRER